MSAATVLLISLSQLFSQNETVYTFGKPGKNQEVIMTNRRLSFGLQTPEYPKPYATNLEHTIHFKLPERNDTSERLTLYLNCFDGFRLQNRPGSSGILSASECTDYLHFNELVACGDDFSPENVHHIIVGPVRQNGIVFRFKSDELQTADDLGFKCHGIIDAKRSCSEYIQLGLPNSDTETITGLKLKRMESALINCAQTIELPDGYSLKITFLEFNLHPSDGEYCFSIGNNPSNSYCSESKDVKNHWPPKELVVEPINGIVIVQLMTYDILLSRSIDTDKYAFVADIALHRGQEQAGSAKQFIFPDPTQNNAKSIEVNDKVAPKPPEPNRIYRQAMIPVPAPGPDDTCMCWDLPADSLFMSLKSFLPK